MSFTKIGTVRRAVKQVHDQNKEENQKLRREGNFKNQEILNLYQGTNKLLLLLLLLLTVGIYLLISKRNKPVEFEDALAEMR